VQEVLRIYDSERAAEKGYADVRTLQRDMHIQEFEEVKDTRLAWGIIEIGEVRRLEECFTTLQNDYLLYHSKANNGQTGHLFMFS